MSYSLSKKFTFGSLLVFALPTTIMMVFMSLYTIVDGMFVSRFVSTNALSSINIVYPAVNIVLGLAIMLSTGSSAIVARKMGEGKPEEARQTFTAVIFLNVVIGLVLAVLGTLFAAPLSRMLGASDVLLADCVTYLRWQLGFAPALMLQILFQMYFVTEGRPGIGLFLTIAAGITNAVLDYILIVPMGMGIAGAAIATVTGYMIPALFGLIYFACAKRSLWFVRPRMSGAELGETCLNNLTMMRFAGEDGVAAITIIQYSEFLLNALFMGFSQGISPVVSFNHGSRNHAQLKQVYRTAMIFTVAASVTVFLFAQFAGDAVVTVFARRGTMVWQLASHGFSVFAMGFLFSGLNIFSSALFTALGNGKVSAVISFVRTFGLIITSLLILPALLGVDGVWLAIPIAELGSTLLSLYYRKRYTQVYQYA